MARSDKWCTWARTWAPTPTSHCCCAIFIILLSFHAFMPLWPFLRCHVIVTFPPYLLCHCIVMSSSCHHLWNVAVITGLASWLFHCSQFFIMVPLSSCSVIAFVIPSSPQNRHHSSISITLLSHHHHHNAILHKYIGQPGNTLRNPKQCYIAIISPSAQYTQLSVAWSLCGLQQLHQPDWPVPPCCVSLVCDATWPLPSISLM